jgi:hypothetical protein
MARVRDEHAARTAEQAFERLTIEHLRPLVALLGTEVPKKKGELVAVLVKAMTDSARVRALYDQLEPLAQHAVRGAAHDPHGRYSRTRFVARNEREPDWYEPSEKSLSYWSDRRRAPTPLVLFFPDYEYLPTDVRAILLRFVPQPDPFTIHTYSEPPPEHTLVRPRWAEKRPDETVPVRVRETAREAEADLPAVLRLIDAGKVRVTDKKRVPTEGSREALAGVLTGGDFYTPDDEDEYDGDPAGDLAIKSFAWPMLVQAAGLAEKRGDTLKLTPAGRAALGKEAPALLDKIWAAWQKNQLLDEFARIEVVKGQGRASLTAVANRRKAALNVLKDCPPGEWFAVDDFWRLMRGTGRGFSLVAGEHAAWQLYLFEQEYGSMGYDDKHTWEQLQGRFVLAFLFEYAATAGLLDVAHIPPQGARGDFWDRWGADDLSCFSRYDGLLYVRINPLGAWLLGQVEEYRPAAPQKTDALRVLANLDVVATHPPPAADRLTLERFADETSPAVWKLSAAKIMTVVEHGGRIEELREFLAARAADEMPATVETFLSDLQHKAEQLTDGGPARLIECASEHVAVELASDQQLRGKCLRAGDRHVVVREADLAAVRKAVRRLGYVWPIPGD